MYTIKLDGIPIPVSPCILLFALLIVNSYVPVSGDYLLIKTRATSCSSTQTELPNLSYAKRTVNLTRIVPCTAPNTNFTQSSVSRIDWYYYQTYPPTNCDGCDCHDVASSTLNGTASVITNALGSVTTIATGTVSSGAFNGSSYTSTTVYPTSNVLQCSSDVGLETRSGTYSLFIVDRVNCSGIVTAEYCPGNH